MVWSDGVGVLGGISGGLTMTTSPPRTNQAPRCLEALPAELKAYRQWVCYRLVPGKNGRTEKIPINPHTGNTAETDNPKTWGTFDDVVDAMTRYRCDGVGFVFTEDDPFTGADLDHCINLVTGAIDPQADDIIARLASFTEFSQSRTGAHVIVKGVLPSGRRQNDFGGLYDCSRFFALTGERFPGTPPNIKARQQELEAIHAELFPPRPPRRGKGATSPRMSTT